MYATKINHECTLEKKQFYSNSYKQSLKLFFDLLARRVSNIDTNKPKTQREKPALRKYKKMKMNYGFLLLLNIML